MRVLIATDRLSLRGGADQHLLDVIAALLASGLSVEVACGRVDSEVALAGVAVHTVRGLSRMVPDTRQLGRLTPLIAAADVVHVQNVMNPTALTRLVESGRAVVTVQDHRVFCPGPGRTLPDGQACQQEMAAVACATCLPDPDYRERILTLTQARREALAGARLVVLSAYMADELAAVGLPGAAVVPPWIEAPSATPQPGHGLLLGGRLVAHKGIERALEAWRQADCGHPLRVAGAGPLESSLSGVESLSWLSRRALLAVMAASRALLFPSRWQEPFGILGLQALSAGTPVIVFPSGGTADWSSVGCISVTSIAQMAAAIAELAGDAQRAQSLGLAGRAAVLERFSQQRLLGALLAVYESAR